MPVTEDIFWKLMFLTTEGLSMHENKLHMQIDGVITLGCTLGPT